MRQRSRQTRNTRHFRRMRDAPCWGRQRKEPTAMSEPISIVFPLYPGVTQLDFTGPHQFLARLPGAALTAASVGGAPIGADGLVFAGLAKLEAIDRCDVLCVPGGQGC